MANTAPIVTSAVESHSTPMSKPYRARLVHRWRRQVGPGFQSRLRPAQCRRCALDRGDLTLEVIAIGGREQAGIVGNRRSGLAPGGQPYASSGGALAATPSEAR
jgi:hypothetical protein